ncbi:winged helix-turn-helix domain-containing protein [Halorussus amylolyticus]|uniref:winged helix-turn-helix domain-containing protein n=1 Tax=Halorussus amylolyticus TaxID=1126242 RepID=UPI0010493E75|nr:MarR family winged helix-turn-helix transcriptional regulator [Halorussus amylolyticus]
MTSETDSERTDDEGLACVSACSPSAKLVYKLLEYRGRRSQSELIADGGLSRDAVRSGVRSLEDCGVVVEYRDPGDARRKVYELTD